MDGVGSSHGIATIQHTFDPSGSDEYYPAWSPEGSWLAFNIGSSNDLHTINAATGGELAALTDEPVSRASFDASWRAGSLSCVPGIEQGSCQQESPPEIEVSILLYSDPSRQEFISYNNIPPGQSFWFEIEIKNKSNTHNVIITSANVGNWVQLNKPDKRLSHPLVYMGIHESYPVLPLINTNQLPAPLRWEGMQEMVPPQEGVRLGFIQAKAQKAGFIEIGGTIQYQFSVNGQSLSGEKHYKILTQVNITELDFNTPPYSHLKALMLFAIWHESSEGNYFGGIEDFPTDYIPSTDHEQASSLAESVLPNGCEQYYDPNFIALTEHPVPWIRFINCENHYYLLAHTMINGMLLSERTSSSALEAAFLYFDNYRYEIGENQTIGLTDSRVSYWAGKNCLNDTYLSIESIDLRLKYIYDSMNCRRTLQPDFAATHDRIMPQINRALDELGTACLTTYNPNDPSVYLAQCDPTDAAFSLKIAQTDTRGFYSRGITATNILFISDPLASCTTQSELNLIQCTHQRLYREHHDVVVDGLQGGLPLARCHSSDEGDNFSPPPYYQIAKGPSILQHLIFYESTNSYRWVSWVYQRNVTNGQFGYWCHDAEYPNSLQPPGYSNPEYYYGSMILPRYYSESYPYKYEN